MSSFTIDKAEYMKAGGFVSGLLSECRRKSIWDAEKKSYADADSYRRWFSQCYEWNARSVAEQYDEDENIDTETYDSEFEKYYGYGKTTAIVRENFRESIAELMAFFSSSLYQTENEEYAGKMELFYKRIIFILTDELLRGISTESWGDFKIKPPKYKYERIM